MAVRTLRQQQAVTQDSGTLCTSNQCWLALARQVQLVTTRFSRANKLPIQRR